jgi:DNA-binding CsgD family transcriptional regulator
MIALLAESLLYSEGDVATARSWSDEGLKRARETANKWLIVLSLRVSAEIALFGQDDIVTARSLAEEALGLAREVGIMEYIADSLSLIAWVEARQRNYPAVRSLYGEILTLAWEENDPLYVPFYLDGLAQVVAAQGEGAWAARLWGAAESLREGIGSSIPSLFRADYEHAVSAARTQLSEKDFVATWAQGRSMTLEQVLGPQGREPIPEAVPSASQPTATKPQPASPAGLSAREVEVLRLLAQGLTNPQIAERLVISLTTVNTHVGSIYNKLGVTSRSTATRYAVEHHLV